MSKEYRKYPIGSTKRMRDKEIDGAFIEFFNGTYKWIATVGRKRKQGKSFSTLADARIDFDNFIG